MPEKTAEELIEIPDFEKFIEENEKSELTTKEENKFIELVQLGIQQKPINFFGHKAVIKTLTNEEEIALGFTLAEYQELPTMSRAYRTCVVAAAIVEIDEKPIYIPLSPKEFIGDTIRAKFRIIKAYSPVIIDTLYDEVQALNDELSSIWTKLGKEYS